jgi:hypothetical protein
MVGLAAFWDEIRGALGAPEAWVARSSLIRALAAPRSPLPPASLAAPAVAQESGGADGTGRRAGWAGAGTRSASSAASRASFQVRAVRRSMRISG